MQSSGITHVIQLAIAPVFLLTAVGTTLNVLTNRLARIVDRGRTVEDRLATGMAVPLDVELASLERRARLIYVAITAAVISALLVSVLIAAAFGGYILGFELQWTLGSLFLCAMLSYTTALLSLLGEVFLALRTFRLGIRGGAPTLD